MTPVATLVALLVDPSTTIAPRDWTAILSAARAERLAATLAHRLEGRELPPTVARALDASRIAAREGRRRALWEVEMARRTLAATEPPVILLKGSAFAAAGLDAAQGREIGDLDILVPKDALGAVEARLLTAGWEWAKPDPYDDAYYRRWMHELPPLIHRERDAMIDVHHTILPPTARPTPDAAALIAAAVPLATPGLAVLSPPDMIVHAALHLFADGDLTGGLRNLWDVDRLTREFAEDGDFWDRLSDRARRHQATVAVSRALRLSYHLFATPVPPLHRRLHASDRLFVRRLLARDGWGRETRPALRFGFYVRSHWLRMPPAMLARHLFTKWRKRAA